MYAIFFDGEFKFKFTCFCLCSLKNRETKSFLRFFFTLRSHAAEGVRVGLTGGVKSHRLSGQISPYCEKNVFGSARIARLCLGSDSSHMTSLT